MSTVTGRMARPRSYSMFADITDATVAGFSADPSGMVVVTFDADLDAETATAIRDRMTSRDDADQAARATLRAADGATNLAEMVRAYALGDPLPAPICPQQP